MSRLIKAAHQSPSLTLEKKPIQLRPVGQKQEAETNFPDAKEQVVRTKEQRLQQKYEQIEKQKQEIEKMKQEAQAEVNQARKLISEEEQASKQRIESAFENAKAEGYNKGYKQGETAGQASYDKAVQEAQDVIRAAKAAYNDYVTKAEPVILDLAFEVANRIVYTSLQKNDDTWTDIVKNVLQEVKDHEEVTVYVSASRFSQTNHERMELESQLPHSKELIVLPDSQLDDNQCIIETSYGRVDASIDSQLQELKTKLEEVLQEGGTNESS
ncbi:flagellar assembly protein FliH [Alteribacillus persepolensis]|uniref:flagellar assembly protein FliH n=1 Tax=Alteribacillus persepolensis TaxID=568899 RepID=UPI001587DD6B|nr:flagellar assembly protein FliH [Alteribacillus persepolensis]